MDERGQTLDAAFLYISREWGKIYEGTETRDMRRHFMNKYGNDYPEVRYREFSSAVDRIIDSLEL